MQIQWQLKHFNELTLAQLYAALQLRIEVFIVEQNCPFQDADDRDQASYHLLGYNNKKLIAYTRLVPPGIAYTEASIGRVVTSPSVRGSGAGKELMRESISKTVSLFGNGPIKIGAQLYLKNFYENFDFVQVSDVYLEDGIPHIYMLKQPS